jgi:hypothetical protein
VRRPAGAPATGPRLGHCARAARGPMADTLAVERRPLAAYEGGGGHGVDHASRTHERTENAVLLEARPAWARPTWRSRSA